MVSLLTIWVVGGVGGSLDSLDLEVMTWWQLLQTRHGLLSSKAKGCFWPEHLAQTTYEKCLEVCLTTELIKPTIPHALQLYFFRIIEKGWVHSMHLWMASSLSMWGCFLPISESQGRRISRPILREDLRWYNSLMASNKPSSHSSFSLRVLKKWRELIQSHKIRNATSLLGVEFDWFVIVSNVKGVGCDQIIALQDLHVVHFKLGSKSIGGARTADDAIGD